MRSFRGSVLVALMLVSALVVVASPAFATPNITASSGTRNDDEHRAGAVSPFVTPSMPSQSSWTARSTNSQLSVPALGSTLSCPTSSVSAYATTTHTQLLLTSVSFGDDATAATRRVCSVTSGSIDENATGITCTATTTRPWVLHVRRTNSTVRSAVRGVASGTVNILSTCTVVVTLGGGASETISIDPNQSCVSSMAGVDPVTYVWDLSTRPPTAILTVACTLRATLTGPVRASSNVSFTGTYNVLADATPTRRFPRETLPSVTALS